jgi:hypothetical protein
LVTGGFAWLSEDLALADNRSTKTAFAPLGALFVLVLAICLVPPLLAQAEDATSQQNSSSNKAGTDRKTNAHNSASKGSKASSSATHSASARTGNTVKAHSASHPSAASRRKSGSVASARSSKGKRSRSRKAVARGQQRIDSERAEEIQEALIREHYLTGNPSGKWDEASEDALRRYQADHGWQSKTVPDSRALISLGLGPNHDHLLNPESAMTTGPESLHATAKSSSAPSESPSSKPSSANPASVADPPTHAPTSEHPASSPQR